MRHFIRFISVSILLFNLSCSSRPDIIPQEEMAIAIADFYVADQAIASNYELRRATDSLKVYESILEHYGYTYEQYKNSISYYIQEKGELQNIHVIAKEILEKKEEEMAKIIERENELNREWSKKNEILRIKIDDLIEYPFYRSARWIIRYPLVYEWRVTDPQMIDLPYNHQWWANNMRMTNKAVWIDAPNVLTRDYFKEKRENEAKKNSKITYRRAVRTKEPTPQTSKGRPMQVPRNPINNKKTTQK